MKTRELRKRAASLYDEVDAMIDAAEEEDRNLTDEEKEKMESLRSDAQDIIERADRLDERERRQAELKQPEPRQAEGTHEPEQKEERKAEVRGDRGRQARKAYNVLRMLRAQVTGQREEVRQAQRELAADGFYGEEGQQRAAGDYYSTLVDADGAILLPTEVVREIEEIGEVLGVARQLVTVFNHTVGNLKVPGATGTLRASAVAEGAAISASMRQFEAVTLNPKKWALIVPWTYEINLEAGPQVLADAQRAIARGFAYAEDDALFNGDGTSSYNSIDGILSSNRASVATYTMGAGDTSFDDFGADDAFLLRRELDPAVRGDGVYVFHPDMEPMLRTLKDTSGSYIFAYNTDTGVATLGGRPVRYTEVLPAIGSDGVSTVFGVYGAFRYAKMALGQGMTSEEMREASVADADTGATINLGSQDLRALKVRELFDIDMNFEEAFVKISTAAA